MQRRPLAAQPMTKYINKPAQNHIAFDPFHLCTTFDDILYLHVPVCIEEFTLSYKKVFGVYALQCILRRNAAQCNVCVVYKDVPFGFYTGSFEVTLQKGRKKGRNLSLRCFAIVQKLSIKYQVTMRIFTSAMDSSEEPFAHMFDRQDFEKKDLKHQKQQSNFKAQKVFI
jgi:hypothetical protein